MAMLGEYNYTVMEAPCRTIIRYALNALAQESQCQNTYKEIYKQIYFREQQ